MRNGNWPRWAKPDGFYNVFDPVTNRYLYNESQFGSIARSDLYTGEVKNIQSRDQALRWNWNAPVLLSPHDSNVLYHPANKLLRSAYRGENWVEISPDLTTNDTSKLTTGEGGDGNVTYCTITTVSESPLVRDLIWVGTDDGNVQVTKDGGKSWTKLNDKIAGNPGYWVSGVVASSHEPGTAYVTTKSKGTGLGPSSVRDIVKAHGGSISVSSPPTIFTLTLPQNQKIKNQNSKI